MCSSQARSGSLLDMSSPSASLCDWERALPLLSHLADITGGQRASSPIHATLLQPIVSDANLRPARRMDACTIATTRSCGPECVDAGDMLILVACVASVECAPSLAVCVIGFAHRPTCQVGVSERPAFASLETPLLGDESSLSSTVALTHGANIASVLAARAGRR
jgi:hypothetical protein